MNAGGSIDGNPSGKLKLNLITIANNTIHTEIQIIFLKGIKKINKIHRQNLIPFVSDYN